MILFVLGPSGTGKSPFGEYLATVKNWHHIEIDQFYKNGIEIHRLIGVWDAYYNNYDPSGLIKEIEKRNTKSGKSHCVLTFPGNLVLTEKHISVVKNNIKIIYMYGSAARCISAFLKREQETQRNLNIDHWITNNYHSYIKMSLPSLKANRVDVWTHNGERRKHQEIFDEVLEWN